MNTNPDELTTEIQIRFAPVLAIVSASKANNSEAGVLSGVRKREARDVLVAGVRIILEHCSCLGTHPNSDSYPDGIVLWDFMNGREIHLTVNERGGYDLAINAPEVSWTETQLTLDLLLLKLLALDYTPAEFRAIAG